MNPFLKPYDTPFNIPPFDKLENEHFKPAILEGIAKQDEEIQAIAANVAPPTFENTILALEQSGELLYNVNVVFNNLNAANTDAEIQRIANEVAPLLAAHWDNTHLNAALFSRVKALFDNKESFNLTQEEAKLLDKKYKSFVRSGANLSDSDKVLLREINAETSILTLKYGQNLLAETNDFELIIENKSDLAGLPDTLIETAAADATRRGYDGKWIFTLANSSVMPFLQYSANRNLRKQIFDAYRKRGNNGNDSDNTAIAVQLANLRMRRAQLLGYESHAAYGLAESMAKNPETVIELLDKLWNPAIKMANKEAADIKKYLLADGITTDVQPYDWRYYTEKIRLRRFDLDEQELKPYFSLVNVRNGIFTVVENLYGLKFRLLDDVPVYQEDVTAWEVTEANGAHVGVLFMDFHPRESKRGGAWMTSYRNQRKVNGERQAPIISIVCNFSKATATVPSLLTFDEVSTFFHEFGHALHGLLSDVTYRTLAGTSVPRDFVELPSQIMENWAAEPEVLKMFAKHYQTGAVIPDHLIEKMQKAATFDQGFTTVEYLAASFLDMSYHSQTEPIAVSAEEFESAAMNRINLIPAIVPRYRSTYFSHIFSGGYSAGYYSYIWSAILDSDAFEAFKTTTLFNPELAKSFRKNILERGFTEDPMVMYKNFRGAEPAIEPLLRKRGLN